MLGQTAAAAVATMALASFFGACPASAAATGDGVSVAITMMAFSTTEVAQRDIEIFQIRCRGEIEGVDSPSQAGEAAWSGYSGPWVNGQERREEYVFLGRRASSAGWSVGAWPLMSGIGLQCQLRYFNAQRMLVNTDMLPRCEWSYDQLAAGEQCCSHFQPGPIQPDIVLSDYDSQSSMLLVGDTLSFCVTLSGDWQAGRLCSNDGQCASGSCKASRCCGLRGKSAGCLGCDFDGDCNSCSNGYALSDFQCSRKLGDGEPCDSSDQCSSSSCKGGHCCARGTASACAACGTTATLGRCRQCYLGHAVDETSGQCHPRCLCPNGTPPRPGPSGFCPGPNRPSCTACNRGFKLRADNTACVPVKVPGQACSSNDQCESKFCKGGYCCVGATSTAASECTICNGTDGSCCGCSPNHELYFVDQTCYNRCSCPNGIPDFGPTCTRANLPLCLLCEAGYVRSTDHSECIKVASEYMF